ncbi:MAG: TonB-dependent hemoglobin/transferrin/lactoferrin family receptor [Sphingorhabdus sp.]
MRRPLSPLLSVAFAGLFVPLQAVTAQDALPADDVDADSRTITVTATKIEQPISEVPATVTVISDEKIADDLASDARDLIRFEPGVSVRRAPSRFTAAFSSTGRGGNESFNIRGIEGNRVLIQVDGIRVPDGFSFGAQSAGRGDFVDLGIVKSVEILRGPASALYGSDGLAGAVSFITSDPADLLADGKSFSGLIRAGYDSADNEFTETAIGAVSAGQFSILGAYTRRDGKELKNNAVASATRDAADSTRTAPNPQDTASNAALGKLVWTPNDNNRIRLTVDHLDARTVTEVLSGRAVAPVVSATGVIDLDARDTTKRDRVSLDWRITDSGIVDSLQVSAYWQNGSTRQFSDEDRNTAADRIRINTFENRVLGGAFEGRSGFSTGSVEHTLLYGGDYSVTRQQGLRDGTVPTPPDVFPTRAFPVTDFTLSGLYLADQIVFGDGLVRLFPALRFDYYKINPHQDPLLPAFFVGSGQDGSKLSPKFGAVVKLADEVSAFGNYARGFQAPSPLEINQFFDNPSAFPFAYRTLRNPDLKPETSESFEGGLRFKAGAVDASITAYSGSYRNFISQVQVGGTGTLADPLLFQYQNLNRVKVKGIEGRIEARSNWGLTGNLAVAYAKGDQFDAANVKTPLQTVDPLKLVAGIGYRAPSGNYGGQLIMTHAARKEESRVAGLCSPACFRPESYTILDATAFVRIAERFTLRAGLFNILDKRYIEYADVRGLADTSLITDAFTQAGRNFSASLSVRF